MLGGAPLDQLVTIDTRDPGFKRAHDVFACSGAALGRALAHVSNTVNPSRIIVYLPGPLVEPKPDSAAAAYLGAVQQEVMNAFAAGNQRDYLIVRPLPARPDELALLGARAAAVCLLESFIEHALRLDGCTTPLRRPGSGNTGAFKVLKALTDPTTLYDHDHQPRFGQRPAGVGNIPVCDFCRIHSVACPVLLKVVRLTGFFADSGALLVVTKAPGSGSPGSLVVWRLPARLGGVQAPVSSNARH